ncbi:MAG TPA: RidA family protein [Candidatus Elarobacter sp.]|jgi:enamine deaminase RidA (YjgF/YER057c/UK114 family)|nr:RidA family protein [Candidatus Elarobacter sp.]
MSIDRIEPGPRMSRAVVYNGTIYVAGHVPDNASAGVADQMRNVLAKLETTLADAGSDKSHLLSVTIYLSNIASFEEMNGVWDAWVDEANPPARATVEARLARADFKVEIVAVAARK